MDLVTDSSPVHQVVASHVEDESFDQLIGKAIPPMAPSVHDTVDDLTEIVMTTAFDVTRFTFALPPNLWIWLARYDGVMPLHSLQLRGPKQAPEIYSLTFGSNFLIAQVFACRDLHFRQIAEATKGPRLQQLYADTGAWMWPPEKTIDDDELQVLDYRFAEVIGGKVG